MVSRIVTAIYVNDLNLSKKFYCDLLGLEKTFEADWIVQLTSPINKDINLTLQPVNDQLIPLDFQKQPQGFSVAFVVNNCDEIYAKALSLNLNIVQKPMNEIYGQRRFLTTDPDGVLVDISSECEPSPEFMEKYFGA